MEEFASENNPLQNKDLKLEGHQADNFDFHHEEDSDQIENKSEQESVIKEEKDSDSDANSEDLRSNDYQNNINTRDGSYFYQSSDNSKVYYAVKIGDNDTLSDVDDIKTDTASADSEDSALGSLPPDGLVNDSEEEGQDRSDGRDLGIGSEAPEEIKLPNFYLDLPSRSADDSVQAETVATEVANENADKDIECKLKTTVGNKNIAYNLQTAGTERKLQKTIENEKLECKFHKTETVNKECTLQMGTKATAKTITPSKSNLKRQRIDDVDGNTKVKRKKQSIKFDSVTVYYFPRAQGFSCVPSQGGSTLGMDWEHSHIQKFSLAEHAMEQRRLHKQILQQLKNERHSMRGASLSSSEDSETEEEASDISESELDLDNYYFLQPVPTRQRRALLRAAGVRKIEGFEKDECRDIRTSREFCGCACKGKCNPEICSCSLGGIKCQVDRSNFPCGCTRDGCGNTTGRIEFNPMRVRTHFIQTLIRLGLEKKNEETLETAKRHWAATHYANSQSCITNTAYDRNPWTSQDDILLCDVNLTPKVEVESCVNNGNFSNIHCDTNVNLQENVSYPLRNEGSNTKSIPDNSIAHFEDSHHPNHAESYTYNILQGKGPPSTINNSIGFDNVSNNTQRFTYTHEQHPQHTDHNPYKGLHSYSATSFEEFAHNSHMSMFSHYGHICVPEYMHKTTTNMHEHNSMQYHAISHNHYNIYKNSTEPADAENKSESHYTTFMTLPYLSSNMLQCTENDENWFSQNTLMCRDHSETTAHSTSEGQAETGEKSTENNASEATENFGELIKNSMVESVTV